MEGHSLPAGARPARSLGGYLVAATLSRTSLEIMPTAFVLAAVLANGGPARAARLLALYTATVACVGPFVGKLLDRSTRPIVSYRWALVTLAGAALALSGESSGPVALAVLTPIVLGLAATALSGAWSAQVSRMVDRSSVDRAHAWDVATFCVASASGPVLATGLVTVHRSLPFVAAAGLALLALAASTLIRAPRAAAGTAPQPVPPAAGGMFAAAPAGRGGILGALRYLFGTRDTRDLFALTLLVQPAGAAIVLSVPDLSRRLTGSVGYAGTLIAALALGALLASVCLGAVPGLARVPAVAWGAVLGGVGLVLPWLPNLTLELLALLLMGCCNGALLTSQFAAAGRDAPQAVRAQVFAVSASSRTAALSATTLVLGLPAITSSAQRLTAGASAMLVGVAAIACTALAQALVAHRCGSSSKTIVASADTQGYPDEQPAAMAPPATGDDRAWRGLTYVSAESGLVLAVASQSIEGSVDLEAATAGVARVRVGSIAADDDLAALAEGADALIVTLQPLPAHRIALLPPSVRVIGRAGVGLDTIDLDAARAHGVAVVHEPTYAVNEVATHAAALLLASHRHIVDAAMLVRDGWGFVDRVGAVPDLTAATLGLIGYGNIGRAVAARMRPFVARVVVFDPFADKVDDGVQRLDSLDELLAVSDLVSLHVPLSEGTRGLLSADRLAAMRPGAVLVNVSRGGLLDEVALAEALHSGRLGAAGLDVFAVEPLPAESPLRGAPRLVMTPHVAWYSDEASGRMARWTLEDVLAFLDDRPLPHGRLAVSGPARPAARVAG